MCIRSQVISWYDYNNGNSSASPNGSYWSSDNLVGVPGIVDRRPVNQFKLLLGCFHLNDNLAVKPREDPAYDKLHKVRP